MKQNQIDEGRFTENSRGLGTVTEKMVMDRAREIARINGRPSHQVLDSDVTEARRELTEEDSLRPAETPAEKLPEEERWDEVAEGPASRAETVPAPDEQTFAENLVKEGLEEAEHDSMREASREKLPRDRT
ncbi:MAG TPA: hypothetical protein VHH88_06990 [Verrucomicrobiae bacterium]|nr:hypothetical protein [Verrucomicrobiae bacterium]